MELSPIDSLSKVLKIVEYQLTMVILICLGVLTATLILIFYIIFWSLKLTGESNLIFSQFHFFIPYSWYLLGLHAEFCSI